MIGIVIGAAICAAAVFLKEKRWMFGPAFLYAWIVFGLNTDNLDYMNYKSRFNGAGGLISEPVFLGILRVFRKLGFSYQGFLFVYAFVCLILISVVILKYSPCPALVLCMYLIFPFCLDTVQIRFFLAMAVFVFACDFICRYRQRMNPAWILLFGAALMAATGIHYSAVFFLICIVLFLDEKRFGFVQYVLIPAGLVVTPLILPVFIELIGTFIGVQKANSWIGSMDRVTTTRMIRLIVIRGGMIFACILAKHTPVRDSADPVEDAEERRIDHIFFMLMLYSMMFTPMEMFLNNAYERMTRPGLLFGALYMTRRIRRTDASSGRLIELLMFGIFVLNFYTNLFMGVSRGGTVQFKSVFLTLFQNNLLF